MIDIELHHVRTLKDFVEDTTNPLADRELAVRRFCFNHRPNAPMADRAGDDASVWTKVDTEHLLELSPNMHAVSSYLIERVVAAE